MREPIEPLFLARRTYRRRRLMDALRLLPWLGVFLFGLPLLSRAPGTASGLLYIFGAWAVLIVLSFALARRFTEDPEAGPESPGDG
jgi:uncharacterized membrane protein